MTISSVTLARTIWLPDDGPKLKLNSVALVRTRTIPTERPPPVGEVLRTEICPSVFNVLMCKFYKFYICAVVGVIIEYLDNMHGVTIKIC